VCMCFSSIKGCSWLDRLVWIQVAPRRLAFAFPFFFSFFFLCSIHLVFDGIIFAFHQIFAALRFSRDFVFMRRAAGVPSPSLLRSRLHCMFLFLSRSFLSLLLPRSVWYAVPDCAIEGNILVFLGLTPTSFVKLCTTTYMYVFL
jgi:hypothetical protein